MPRGKDHRCSSLSIRRLTSGFAWKCQRTNDSNWEPFPMCSQALQLVAGSLWSETTPSCGQAERSFRHQGTREGMGQSSKTARHGCISFRCCFPYLVGIPAAPALGSEPPLHNQPSAPQTSCADAQQLLSANSSLRLVHIWSQCLVKRGVVCLIATCVWNQRRDFSEILTGQEERRGQEWASVSATSGCPSQALLLPFWVTLG